MIARVTFPDLFFITYSIILWNSFMFVRYFCISLFSSMMGKIFFISLFMFYSYREKYESADVAESLVYFVLSKQ